MKSHHRRKKRRMMSVKQDVWKRISEHAKQFGALFEELGHAQDDGMSRADVEHMRRDILHCLERARADMFTHTRPYTWTPHPSDKGCLTLRVLSEVASAAPNLLFNPRANVQWCTWDKYFYGEVHNDERSVPVSVEGSEKEELH